VFINALQAIINAYPNGGSIAVSCSAFFPAVAQQAHNKADKALRPQVNWAQAGMLVLGLGLLLCVRGRLARREADAATV